MSTMMPDHTAQLVGVAVAMAAALAACNGEESAPGRSRPTDSLGDSPTATRTAPAERQVKSADGVDIAYRMVGSGDPAVVLIHGWSCDATYWDAQVPELARRYTVVTLDLAGHGRSGADRANWSIPAFGEDVAAVIRALPRRHVVLVGHSMGGPVALEAARLASDPVVAIIGVDTFSDFAGPEMTGAQQREFMADLRRDPVQTTRTLVGDYLLTGQTDPALEQRIVDDMSSAPPAVAIASMDALLRYDVKPAAAALRIPVTAIDADFDGITDEAKSRRLVPQFRVVPMKGVGHFLQMERPTEFNALLIAELERVTGQGNQ
jgi:pimeloyl-ACP methyl ester carboxylesterase